MQQKETALLVYSDFDLNDNIFPKLGGVFDIVILLYCYIAIVVKEEAVLSLLFC